MMKSERVKEYIEYLEKEIKDTKITIREFKSLIDFKKQMLLKTKEISEIERESLAILDFINRIKCEESSLEAKEEALSSLKKCFD